jgi:hypothetical protein
MAKQEITLKNKPKVEQTKKPDKNQKKLPMRNMNIRFDRMGDQVKTVILDQLSQRSLIQQTQKLIPRWVINFLIEKELPKADYLIPILNWMMAKLIAGDWDDVDARNIARMTRGYLKRKYLDSIHEAAEREIESLDKFLKEKSQSTLDDIYETKPKTEKKENEGNPSK